MSGMPCEPCTVCCRASGAIAVHTPRRGYARFCSLECSEVWMKRRPQAPDEEAAIAAGGAAAGKYLDDIGKSDLAALTPEEWTHFCATLFKATCADLRRRASEWVPF